MKVLIACEYSGIVRDAFIEVGHDAFSCDLLPSEKPGNHLQCDVREILNNGWDLMVAHPPCTRLTKTGRWFYNEDIEGTLKDAAFFMMLWHAPIKRICIENPAGIMSCLFRKPDQYIEPFYFGESHRKKTGLWLKNLPKLNGKIEVAKDLEKFFPQPIYTDKNGKKRYFTDSLTGGHKRSKTFFGIAEAMAQQWGRL